MGVVSLTVSPRFDHPVARNLVEILPAIIHIEAAASPYQDRIHSTLALLAAEAKELRPGGESVITRLADILVIQAIRTWIETDPAAQTGWLGALDDPQIGRAISLIHRDPAREWTVVALAAALKQLQIATNVVNAVLYATLAAAVGIAIVAVGGGGISPMRSRWGTHPEQVRRREAEAGRAGL